MLRKMDQFILISQNFQTMENFREIHSRNCMRVRAFPFGEDVVRFLEEHDRLIVVEQNRDAQLKTLFAAEAGINPQKMRSVLCYSGMPPMARDLEARIKEAIEQ